MSQYLEGLKPTIRDKIGVHIPMSLSEARNMTMKAKVSLQEKFKSETLRRNFNNNYQPNSGRFKSAADNTTAHARKFNEEKAEGKQKEKEVGEKEVQRISIPYVKPYPNKCFKCNQSEHRSSDCPLKKSTRIMEMEAEDEEDRGCCEANGEDDEYDD